MTEQKVFRSINPADGSLLAEIECCNEHRLESGCAFVNELVKSDPRVPFGGIKGSGYGRELSRHGMHEFLNAKTVWVRKRGLPMAQRYPGCRN